MDDELKERMRRHVEIWRRAGVELEAVRRDELRNFDPTKNRIASDALMEMGVKLAGPDDSSGMIEMRRLLDKGRR